MVVLREIFQPQFWTRDRKRRGLAFGLALSLNLVLFIFLGLTLRVRIGFDLPDLANPLPVEIISAAQYAELTKPEPEPEPISLPKKQLRIEPPQPKPEPPKPEPEPEPITTPPPEPKPTVQPEKETIEIPDILLEEKRFTPPEAESEPLPEIITEEISPQIVEKRIIVEETPLAEIEPEPEAPPEQDLQDQPEQAPQQAVAEDDLPLIEEDRLVEETPPLEVPPTEAILDNPIEEEIIEEAIDDPFAITSNRPSEEQDPPEEIVVLSPPPPNEAPKQAEETIQPAPIANNDDPYAGLTGAEIDALYAKRSTRPLPNVNLPSTEAGGSLGVTAIYCPEVFDNEDKIQECAGRPEIRSGWRPGQEDWTEVVQSLARGGLTTTSNPITGPAGERHYAPNSPHAPLTTEQAIIGRKAAENLKDARKNVDVRNASVGIQEQTHADMGEGAEVPNFITDTWEPSWTRNDEPYMDKDVLKEIEKGDE